MIGEVESALALFDPSRQGVRFQFGDSSGYCKMVSLVSRQGDSSDYEMGSLVSRHGRRLQRYRSGRRLVAGCIPYKFKMDKPCSGDIGNAIEVLVISSQKGPELMFPKGGWELDESMSAAASREAYEEAGVRGKFEGKLGTWSNKEQDKIHYIFALRVTEVLQQWPEMNNRERKWVTLAEARQVCKHSWMREALDKLEEFLSSPTRQETDLDISH